jgi:hypothetical protein
MCACGCAASSLSTKQNFEFCQALLNLFLKVNCLVADCLRAHSSCDCPVCVRAGACRVDRARLRAAGQGVPQCAFTATQLLNVCLSQVAALAELQKTVWRKLEAYFHSNLCLVGHFSKTQ